MNLELQDPVKNNVSTLLSVGSIIPDVAIKASAQYRLIDKEIESAITLDLSMYPTIVVAIQEIKLLSI